MKIIQKFLIVCTMSELSDPKFAGIIQSRTGFHGGGSVAKSYPSNQPAIVITGDAYRMLTKIESESVDLVMSSPPYNIGKSYEKRSTLESYLDYQQKVLTECVRTIKPGGSLCWQVGNYISDDGEVVPLDIIFYPIIKSLGLKMMGRIIWRLEHGLHAKKRFSGRHETILWFVKPGTLGEYKFDFDKVRIPQKYPGKKSSKTGKYSGNIKGKNPGDVWDEPSNLALLEASTDVWEHIPNVKNNHKEKTEHPAQYPIELVERMILSLTDERDLVLDPYMGSGTTGCAAVLHNRKTIGIELIEEYSNIATSRIEKAMSGTLVRRPAFTEIHVPDPTSKLLRREDQNIDDADMTRLFD